MKLGIFTKSFKRPNLDQTLDAVVEYGLEAVQLNLDAVDGVDMPADLSPSEGLCIEQAVRQRGLEVAALSGTFNMIHPDLLQRQEGMRRLALITAACASIGTRLVTLCTGTCDPDYQWRRHPDNDTHVAWQTMLRSMEAAVQLAEAHDVILVFEPEVNNVVDSARKARQLLDEIRSPHLKVVIDGANLFHTGELSRMQEVLNEAFDLLAGDICLAHAKDLEQDGDAGHQAAGTGVLDYEHYLRLLKDSGFDGTLVLHSLAEHQVAESLAFVRRKLGC